MNILWYDRKGETIPVEQANKLLADPEYVRVGLHEEGGYRVLTRWLGLDHRFVGQGPPLLFETSTVRPDGYAPGGGQRYTNEIAALAGHDQAVMHLRTEILKVTS